MEEIKGYVKCMINSMERLLDLNPKNLTVKSTIENLKGLLKLIEEKEAAPEVEAQEQLKEKFSPCTGEKLHDICPNCWVKNNKSYNCGYKKCPGYKLFKLEKSKS